MYLTLGSTYSNSPSIPKCKLSLVNLLEGFGVYHPSIFRWSVTQPMSRLAGLSLYQPNSGMLLYQATLTTQ